MRSRLLAYLTAHNADKVKTEHCRTSPLVTRAEVIGHVDKHNRPRSPSSFYIRDHEDSDAFLGEIDTFESQSSEEIINRPDEILAKPLAIMVGLDQEDSDGSDKARSTCGVPPLATVEAYSLK